MMANSLQQIVHKLTGEGEKIHDFFNNLPNSLWDQQLYTDGAEWTVHEVLAHIVEAEGSLYRLFRNIIKGGPGVPDGFDVNAYNAAHVERVSEHTSQELLALFEEGREQMVEFVGGLSEADLDKTGNHPYLGQSTLGEMLRLFVLHPNLHIRDIRKAFEGRLQ